LFSQARKIFYPEKLGKEQFLRNNEQKNHIFVFIKHLYLEGIQGDMV